MNTPINTSKKFGYGYVPASNKKVQENVKLWIDLHVSLRENSSVSLKEMYYYFSKDENSCKCSKTVFFKILQSYFENELLTGDIQIRTLSGKTVLGVDLQYEM